MNNANFVLIHKTLKIIISTQFARYFMFDVNGRVILKLTKYLKVQQSN